MDLTFTEAEEAFRAEARAWLEANVPTEPLPSSDTADGFAAHLEWERLLFERRWSVVSWPEEYGGRDASLVGVADLRGGVLPRGRARSGSPRTASSCSRPTIFDFGTAGAEGPLPARDGQRRRTCGPGLVRARRRLATSPASSSRAGRDDERGGWVLNGQKTWTTRGRVLHALGLRPVPHRPRGAAPHAA